MTATKKRKGKKTRKNRLPAVYRYGTLVATLVLLAGAVQPSAAADKKEREEQAIIAGTVFQPTGHLLRGAKVEVVAQNNPKIKGSAISDAMGDFAIRVPAGRGTYDVTATAKGFESAHKTVEIYESEKVRTNLILSSETKK